MIKKQKLSLSIGLVSLALAFVWVGIIIVGITSESDNIRLKEVTGQKVTYRITDVKDDLVNEPVISPKEKKYISLILDDMQGDLEVDKVVNYLPEGTTFGLSPYNKTIHKNIALLTETGRNFLVKIPLMGEKGTKKLDLYPGLGTKDIENKIENIYNMTQGSVGFYNQGNDNFLEKEDALEATIRKIYDLDAPFFYGVRDKTSILESEEGSTFKIKAFDIEILDDNVEGGLKNLEELAEKNGEAVGILKVSNYGLDVINKWYRHLKAKHIEVVPVKSLFNGG